MEIKAVVIRLCKKAEQNDDLGIVGYVHIMPHVICS